MGDKTKVKTPAQRAGKTMAIFFAYLCGKHRASKGNAKKFVFVFLSFLFATVRLFKEQNC